MLAKIAPTGRDFKALSDYLIHGRGPASSERVAWTLVRNLPTEDPDIAAKLMAATARLSVRTMKPVYHVMIAWAPDEQPSADVMQAIAGQALELSGLGQHQAFVVGHGDTSHHHLHMMINRVHPESGKAWRVAHDFKLFDRVMAQLADAYGFKHAPAHLFNPDETKDLVKLPGSAARRAAAGGADTLRPQWSRKDANALSRRLSEHLDEQSSAEDVELALSRFDLKLEPKGRGHVVGTAAGYVKASALGLDIETRFLRLHRNAVPIVDAVDVAKGLRMWGLADDDDVKAAIDAVSAARRQRKNEQLDKD